MQRLDFARNWIFPDLPDPAIEVQYGEPMTLMRNINTYEGIVKNKRCWIISKFGQCVVVEFEGGLQKTIPKINFETSTNGIKFTRTQLPLKHFYAGTVHKSQGMTLSKVVIDLRSGFWEHGMLYVSLSRVRDPKNICILLPKVNSENDDDSNHFVQPVADIEIVNLVKEIENDVRVKSSNTDNQDQPDLNNDSQKQNQSNQENANETNFLKTLQCTDEFLIDFENEIDDLLPNFIETRKYQKEKDMSFSLKRNDLMGLNNYKNTCYINSFLQIIYHISLVKKQLIKNAEGNNKYENEIKILFHQMDILSLEEANKVAEPISFINILNIDASISEDVSEFACDLLNRLSKSIQCFFTITTQEEVKRSNEGIIDITTSDYINDFFIYVNSLNHKSLRDEIKSQFEEVQIKINNEVIIKKRRVHKNPLILLVSINRTFFDNGIQKKSNVPFKINRYLDFYGEKYKLFASIVHHGKSIKNGHYTSMIDCGKYWCEFNDTHVFEVKEYRAIKLTEGKDNSSGILAVYILLSEYDKTVF